MQIKKQQLELDMEQWTGSKLGKEYVKAVYCHPAYLTYMQSISLLGEISAMICRGYHPNGRKELKILLMKVKEESEKAGLKPSIQKTMITTSGPITSFNLFNLYAEYIIAGWNINHDMQRLPP